MGFEQPEEVPGVNLPFEEAQEEPAVVLDLEAGKKAMELQEQKAAAEKRAAELKQYGPAIANDRARGRGELHIAKPPAAERGELAKDILGALGESIEFESADDRDKRASKEKAA